MEEDQLTEYSDDIIMDEEIYEMENIIYDLIIRDQVFDGWYINEDIDTDTETVFGEDDEMEEEEEVDEEI